MHTQVHIEEAQRQAQHLGLALLAVPLSRHAGVLRYAYSARNTCNGAVTDTCYGALLQLCRRCAKC